MSAWVGRFRSVLRIVAAGAFMLHGTMKLFAFPAAGAKAGGTVALFSQAGLAGVLETFGGLLLLLGLFTRPVAFILAGEMAVAYFQVHFPRSFWPVLNGGEPAVLYCFLWLYLSAAGAGPWSLDACLHSRFSPINSWRKGEAGCPEKPSFQDSAGSDARGSQPPRFS